MTRARRPYGDPGGPQVFSDGLSTDAGRFLDLMERPFEPAQRDDLLLLLFSQDVHPGADHVHRHRVNVSELLPLAAFQVSITGRFWVSTQGSLSLAGSRIESSRFQSSLYQCTKRGSRG